MKTESKSSSQTQLFPGFWVLLGVSALLALAGMWRWSAYPHHLKQLARDYSSIYIFEKPPVINHAGTLIGSIHTTERGVGVFIANCKTRTEQNLCEMKSMDFVNDLSLFNTDANQVFGWSPDDKTFGYFWNYSLYFMSGDGKTEMAGVNSNGIKSFVWTAPDECAYIDDSPKLAILTHTNGSWVEAASWPLPDTNGLPHSLFIAKSGGLAWLTENVVWQWDVASGAITPKYSNFQKQIASASYAKATDLLLLVENIRNRRGNTTTLTLLSGETNTSTIKNLSGKDLILDAQWVNQGKGYAYLKENGDNSSLFVKVDDAATEQIFFPTGQVENIFCNGEDARIYAFAVKTNEPPGFWQCDVATKNASYVLPPWGYKDLTIHFQPLLTKWAPFGDRHVHQYTLIQPANFSPQKKYPLIIAMDHYAWTGTAQATYAQCMANCGAFVALSGYRYNPHKTDIETVHDYTNVLQGIYNQLATNSNVDTKRVSLFTASLASAAINDLVEQYPTRWKGVMLSSPILLPEPKAGMTANVVMAAGVGEEKDYPARFRQFQKEACKLGILMQWHFYPDEGHIERAQNTMFEQACLMGNMVFEK